MGQDSQVPYTVNNKRRLLFSEESLMLQVLFPPCCCEARAVSQSLPQGMTLPHEF